MIYAYYRVSTDTQDFENQKLGVLKFCKNKNWNIDREIIDNGVSGTKEPEKRLLGGILKTHKNTGGRVGIRTPDPLIKSQLLYQLSYASSKMNYTLQAYIFNYYLYKLRTLQYLF